MMGAPNLISDNVDCGLSYSVISYLKKLSQQVCVPELRRPEPHDTNLVFALLIGSLKVLLR